MTDRVLYWPGDPAAVAEAARAKVVPGREPEVILHARRSGLPNGVALEITVDESVTRTVGAGLFTAPREALTPQSVGRSFMPWHVEVNAEDRDRWHGYFDPEHEGTLLNFTGATSPGELVFREAPRVEMRAATLPEAGIARTHDLAELKGIHAHLFQDVYPWAGEPRTVNMLKGGAAFVSFREFDTGFEQVQDYLSGRHNLRGAAREDFVESAAHVYNAVNNLHVFREGNGRTQRQWMNSLARDAGFDLNWGAVQRDENDNASHAARSVGDLGGLREMFDKIVTARTPAGQDGAVDAARQAAATAYRGRVAYGSRTDATSPAARAAPTLDGRGSRTGPQGPERA